MVRNAFLYFLYFPRVLNYRKKLKKWSRKIPQKGERFSDFIATFAMSVGFDTYFDLQH